MNCCDYDCNQGRNCPARGPAKVARIGRKDYAPAPLPPSPWRRQLQHLARWMLTGILVLMMWAAILVALIHA